MLEKADLRGAMGKPHPECEQDLKLQSAAKAHARLLADLCKAEVYVLVRWWWRREMESQWTQQAPQVLFSPPPKSCVFLHHPKTYSFARQEHIDLLYLVAEHPFPLVCCLGKVQGAEELFLDSLCLKNKPGFIGNDGKFRNVLH